MISTYRALLAAGVALTVSAASAEDLSTPHTLEGVTVTGSRTVPNSQLMAVLKERKGDKVTKSDIVADRDAIMDVLGKANVGGSVAARMTFNPNTHRLSVEFVVNDKGVQAPVVTKVAPKLHQEIFVGNKSVATDKLVAAAGLVPGQELSNEKVAAAEQAIAAAYKAAKVPVDMALAGATQVVSPGQVDVTWTITETKGKKKRNTEDEGQKAEP